VNCTIRVAFRIARVDAEIRLWKKRAEASDEGISGIVIGGHEAALASLSRAVEVVTHESRQIGFDANALDAVATGCGRLCLWLGHWRASILNWTTILLAVPIAAKHVARA